MASAPSDRRQRVAQLAEQLRGWEAADTGRAERGLPSGCSQLDALMPGGGFCRGSLVEWITCEPGAGATTLALAVARAVCGEEGWLVVVDPAGTFYPPAAAALGAPLRRLVWVRPPAGNLARWAIDQALRSSGVAVVLAWPETLDATTFRRWQLAVEESRVLGLLVRPAAALKESTWAEARLLVEPRPSRNEDRRWRVELLHARRGWGGRSTYLGMHHDTGQWFTDRIESAGGSAAGALRVVPSLAAATLAASPAAGAASFPE